MCGNNDVLKQIFGLAHWCYEFHRILKYIMCRHSVVGIMRDYSSIPYLDKRFLCCNNGWGGKLRSDSLPRQVVRLRLREFSIHFSVCRNGMHRDNVTFSSEILYTSIVPTLTKVLK
jgi:hypothetical protein